MRGRQATFLKLPETKIEGNLMKSHFIRFDIQKRFHCRFVFRTIDRPFVRRSFSLALCSFDFSLFFPFIRFQRVKYKSKLKRLQS